MNYQNENYKSINIITVIVDHQYANLLQHLKDYTLTLSMDLAIALISQFVCAYDTNFNHTMQAKSINVTPDKTAESQLQKLSNE